MKNELEKSLDLAPLDQDVIKNVPALIEPIEEVSEIQQDFEKTRESLYDLIDKGMDAIEELVSIAKQSQHPRSYEALNRMLKTVGDMHKDLLEAQVRKKKLLETGPSSNSNEEGVVNNTQNIFVGTTAELSKMLEDARRNKDA